MPRFNKEAFAKLESQMTKKNDDVSSDEDSLPEINKIEICSICLNEIVTDYMRLPCGHVYHTSCIMRWKKIKQQCPYCRLDHHNNYTFYLFLCFLGEIADQMKNLLHMYLYL